MAGERVTTTETLAPTELGKRAYDSMVNIAEALVDHPYFARNAAKQFFDTSADNDTKGIRFAPRFRTGDVSYEYVARFEFNNDLGGLESAKDRRTLKLNLQRLSKREKNDYIDDGAIELVSIVRGRDDEKEFFGGKISVPGKQQDTEEAFSGISDFLKGFYPSW